MRVSALEMMRLLEPRDFETLVDLMFSTSGWRRGIIGNTQKTLDLDLLLPSTGERAFVQVKSIGIAADGRRGMRTIFLRRRLLCNRYSCRRSLGRSICPTRQTAFSPALY
jgi:hypothetical protein